MPADSECAERIVLAIDLWPEPLTKSERPPQPLPVYLRRAVWRNARQSLIPHLSPRRLKTPSGAGSYYAAPPCVFKILIRLQNIGAPSLAFFQPRAGLPQISTRQDSICAPSNLEPRTLNSEKACRVPKSAQISPSTNKKSHLPRLNTWHFSYTQSARIKAVEMEQRTPRGSRAGAPSPSLPVAPSKSFIEHVLQVKPLLSTPYRDPTHATD